LSNLVIKNQLEDKKKGTQLMQYPSGKRPTK